MSELVLEGLKAKQQKTWASGDYGAVAALIHPMAEETTQAADLAAGAARPGRRLRRGGAGGRREVRPDQERTAVELTRVCRRGGTLAMANWAPDGFIGEMFRTVGRRVPPPPGIRGPVEWGSEDRVRELF